MVVDTNYQLKPGESVDQYNARIASYNASKNTAPATTPAPVSNPQPTQPQVQPQTQPQTSTADVNYMLKPGESIEQYNARVATYNASKPSGGTVPAPQPTPTAQPNAQPAQPATQSTNKPAQGNQQAQPPQITANLAPGASGPEVASLQNWLISQGYSIPAIQNGTAQPGTYGDQTMAAVAQWQKDQGLHITDPSQYGYFGPISRAAIANAGTQLDNSGVDTTGQDPNAQNAQDGFGQGTSTNELFQNNFDSILQQYGLAPRDPNKTQTQQAIEDYKAIYESLGIPDIKKAHEDSVKEFAALQDELSGKIADINEDPWLSAGVRQKEVENIKSRYETKLAIATNKMQLFQSQVTAAQAQADDVIGMVHNNQVARQNAVNQAIDVTTKQVEAMKKLTEIDPANFKEVQGGLFDIKAGKWLVQPKPDTGNGLTPNQINSTVNQIAGAFDNEPIVKRYNVIKEGYQYAQSLANKTNPTATDDQGLIYAFAKAQDPDSAVREGEYLTVQKYSQSFAETGWANLQRLAKNQSFLTDEARKNMVATIGSKYQASEASYQNTYNEYQRQIQDAYTGQPRQITDYSKTNPAQQNTTYSPGDTIKSGGVLYRVGPDGETITPYASAL